MKCHLYRSDRSTWCGRVIDNFISGPDIVPLRNATRDRAQANCRTCLRADAAEQRKEDAASK